jgi:type I restriction enzyme M protein
MNQQELSSLIWSVADLLRNNYRRHEYGKVILPFTVLRRIDCVLAPTKAAALEEWSAKTKAGIAYEPFVKKKTGLDFFNVSTLDMTKLVGDQDNVKANLESYIQGFSTEVRSIFDHFEFSSTIDRLHKEKMLYLVTEQFCSIDLHPDRVSNIQMGLVFEELIRKFSEESNSTAGEHFTPREVIRLMVSLLFTEDHDALTRPGIVRTIYDPTAGTGGMLSESRDEVMRMNPRASVVLAGQEINAEAYAICKADMLIRGQDIRNIVFGDTLANDGLHGKTFDYMFSNPPFGVEWKKIEKVVRDEHEKQGFSGRFGPGLPRVSDGSMLFLLHLLSKMRPAVDGGSRIGVVLNGSPLFTGGAGSGESEIRRYVIENDLLEAVIALPTDMFFNTSIATYIWLITNRKADEKKGLVQLIDASSFWQKMRKSLGSKRKAMSAEHIGMVSKLFGEFLEARMATVFDQTGAQVGQFVVPEGAEEPPAPVGGKVKFAPISRIFKNEDFGYRTITVERPMRDVNGKIIVNERGKAKGKPQPDTSLRDTENVPLTEDVDVYFEREVQPHAPDAWIDHEKTKIGYEIPFNRHFYVFEPPRVLEEIDADLKQVTDRIKVMIEGLSA